MHVKTLKEKITLIEERLQYAFRNPDILVEAFIHPSFKNECKHEKLSDNERLEFLGDAVLNLIVSHVLYTTYPDETEGSLSKKKAHIVSRSSCARLMSDVNLHEFLLLGRGELIQGSRSHESHLANLYEAIIGALFLDGGLPAAHRFVLPILSQHLDSLISNADMNWKAKLQERCAQHKCPLPIYTLIKEEGPGHEKIFEVAVVIGGEEIARGSGRTKKVAEQLAAELGLSRIESNAITLKPTEK